MHHFKCHSARTCYTWAAGGPISDDKTSKSWQDKNKGNMSEAKKKKKADRCTRIAKRKYDVWPSAYASGAVVKCRQGKIWKGVSEGAENLEDIIREQVYNAVNEACWSGYKQVGMKKKGGKEVPNCVPLEEAGNLEDKIKKALRDEGGAAGMSALEDHTKANKKEIKIAIKGMKSVGLHKDGDYILDDEEEIDVNKLVEKITYEVVSEFLMNEKKKKTDYSKEKESGLHGWFSRAGGKGKSKGWVDCNTCRKNKKTGRKTCKSCGRQKGEKRSKYPSCRPTPSDCGTKGKGKKWGKRK